MKRHKTKILFFLILGISWSVPQSGQASCKDPELRRRVAETAQKEGVDEKELLSIIAHESDCHYLTIAWNQPGLPKTAKSKFLPSLEEAKALATNLITTGLYRVDVGIGQINNEAHIQPKEWSLDEVLSPETALNRVADVLKERGWRNYHSSNPFYSVKWRRLALNALNRVLRDSKNFEELGSSEPIDDDFKTGSGKNGNVFADSIGTQKLAPLLIYNGSSQATSPNGFEIFNSIRNKTVSANRRGSSPLVVCKTLPDNLL